MAPLRRLRRLLRGHPHANSTSYTLTPGDDGRRSHSAVTASNAGGSVEADSQPTAAVIDPQPSFPIRAAFYYPWFPEAWNQQGLDPFTHYNPSLGFYDSIATDVIAQHIQSMEYGNIAGRNRLLVGSGNAD